MKREHDSLLRRKKRREHKNGSESYSQLRGAKSAVAGKRKQQQKENAEIFKKLAPASFVYALIYTVCIYKNMTGAAVLLWVAATIGYICYIVKTVKERKIFNTTIFFAAYMLILAVNTFTTGNEWIIWMNYCWILHSQCASLYEIWQIKINGIFGSICAVE